MFQKDMDSITSFSVQLRVVLETHDTNTKFDNFRRISETKIQKQVPQGPHNLEFHKLYEGVQHPENYSKSHSQSIFLLTHDTTRKKHTYMWWQSTEAKIRNFQIPLRIK